MAHYDKQSGQIILSPEDKEIFKRDSAELQGGRTPKADRIIKWVLTGETNEQD